MLLRELFEAKARRVVAIMPGGFHPFHPGHKSLYDWAVKTFGKENVYVAATNDTAARPFPFDVKKKLAAMAGVPEDRFIQVKSPFNNREYANLLDGDTALVFVRSQKDKTEQPLPDQTKKNGEPGYLRSYTGKNLNTADEMGYMAYGPTINFDFSGMQIKSASELRATWPEMSDEDKLKAAKLMYGNGAPVAVKLLDQALGDKEAPVGEATNDDGVAWIEKHDPYIEYHIDAANNALKAGNMEQRDLHKDLARAHRKAQIQWEMNINDGKAETMSLKAIKASKEIGYTEEDIAEILGFATKRPKQATRTVKRRPPEEDSVQDKIKKRRALASKVGVSKAFSSSTKDLEKYFGKQ